LAVRGDGDNPGVLSELARILLIVRRDDEAAEPFARRAVEHAKKPTQKIVLGDILAWRGSYEEALAVWLQAMKLTGDDTKGRANRARRDVRDGDTYFRTIEYAEAERAYLRAAVLDPRSREAAAGVARSMLRQRFAQGAVAWAKRARELAPEDAQIRVVLGDALNASDDEKAARAEYKEALRLDPNNRAAQRRLQERL
jgi:tetratricopeptide (TPR) repeat protein